MHGSGSTRVTLALVSLMLVAVIGAVTTNHGEAEAQTTGGSQTETAYTVAGIAFTGASWLDPGFGSRDCLGATFVVPCTMFAPLQLPAGALVTRIEADVCDEVDTLIDVSISLVRVERIEAGEAILAQAGPTTGAPGCVTLTGTLSAPETIDNAKFAYMIEHSEAPLPGDRVHAVRVFYRRQVSPAPASATFGDVPTTHLFHQFIEALAAAGITAGCSASPPRYCPDAPVTRGQMAVFLSRALGLHFAP